MNIRLTLFLYFLLAMQSSCTVNESYIPRHLDARNVSSGPLRHSYTVSLDGDTLIYKVGGKTESIERIKPSMPQWKEFRNVLDEINVWNWRKEYFIEGIADGNVWLFEVEYSDHVVKSKGQESYPLQDGSASEKPTMQHNRYVKALRALLGGREFCCD